MPLERLDVEGLGEHVGIILRRIHTANLSVVLVEVDDAVQRQPLQQ